MSDRSRVSGRRRAEQHKSGFDRTAFKIPDGIEMLKITEAKPIRVDILCYVAGKGNPNADEGSLHMERTYWVHRGIGPNEDSYCCPAKMLNKACPICEARAKLSKRADADEKMVADLAPKERQLWLMRNYADEELKAYLFDMSYHLFGKVLDNRVKDSDPDDAYEFYADPVDGKMLRISWGSKNFAGGTFYECTGIDFKARPEGVKYGRKFIESLPCLDDLIIVLGYDQLKAIFLQTGDAVDADPAPAKPAAGGDDEWDEPKAAKPPKAPPPDEDEPAPKPKPNRAPPPDDEDPPPKPKAAKPAPKDDDEWDDAPPAKPAKAEKPPKAPPPDDDEPPAKPAAAKKAAAPDDDWD
jgi:hypothetical protein